MQGCVVGGCHTEWLSEAVRLADQDERRDIEFMEVKWGR